VTRLDPHNDARPGAGTGAGKASAGKLATEDQSTASVGALDSSYVALTPAELAELLSALGPVGPTSTQAALSDAERLAMALVDTFGPTWARRLAGELLAAADDIAPPRTPWPGGADR
jgi:hypothetical protein